MKNILGIILLIIFIIWMIFIFVDCIRISNFDKKPIITIYEKEYDNVQPIEYPKGTMGVGEYGTIYVGLWYIKISYNKWQLDKELSKPGYIVYLFGIKPISGFEYH